MEKFDYTEEQYFEPGSAIGLILLQTDEVLENEIRHMLPNDTVIYHTRVPSGDEVTADTLAAMEAEIPAATRLLPPAGEIGVVAYCCTSGTTVIGEENVESAVHSVLPNVKVTNPLSAVKARLASLGARQIGLLTPYEPHVSQAMADHLQENNINIAAFGSFYEKEEAKVTRIAAASILDAVEKLAGNNQCDAIFASCTNLRTLNLLDEAQHRIGKPVISSNSALAWHINELRSGLA